MTWQPFYAGTGTPRERVELAPPPPWRVFPRNSLHEQFVPRGAWWRR
ncbi:hypothetical protein LUX12_00100 [Streptomyces somaliensis]|nr:hypothetical protein [Streptomyces somaliensis]MCP9943566.1 hypothetical protein [Streptomyces somaliensis]